jgi:murein DD-endopeptidase MepM/ murein hydrolase activator NlpD
MSLTLLYRSKTSRFVFQVRKHQLVAAFVLLGGVMLISSRSTNSPIEAQDRVAYAQTGLQEQRKQVEQLKLKTEQQLTGMILKLGEMQGQLQRLNALGERLVVAEKLNQEEFSFNQLPASGGPGIPAELNINSNNELLVSMDKMLLELDNKTQQLQALESILLSHHIEEQSELKGRPINSGWLSSYYGVRKDPFDGLPAMHKGLDFAGKEGDTVVSTGAGLVTWAGERYGYGNLVEVDHGDGLTTRYGHNKQLNVKIGDVVTKGQIIALMGSTGRSTGPHVHYEVLRHGQQQDPLPYVYNN